MIAAAMRCNIATALLVWLAACTAPRETVDDLTVAKNPAIACTLTPDELNSRREQLLPGLMRRASEVTDLANGLRLRFDTHPGLLAELVGIVDQERTCCSFLRFQLTAEPDNGPITFEVTGPPGTREMLRSL